MGAERLPPRWAPPITLLLSVAGVAVSAYLTYEHYTTSSTLACPNTGVLNCLKVTTSAESKLIGIPVALLGSLFFLGMVVICLPALWRAAAPQLAWVRLGASLTGVAMVVYLIYVELFVLDAICVWCTAVHAITLALFSAVVLAMAAGVPAERAAR